MLSLLAAAALSTTPLQRAADFANAVGMNVHIEYTDGGYRDLAHVLACLQYIGVRKVRDAAPDPANQGQAGYAALAKAGIRFDLVVGSRPIAPALKRITLLDREVPGAVESLEGPNEVNNQAGFSFEGETDPHKAATHYQNALYAAIKADTALARLPVLAFTDYPYTPGRADLQNEHIYPAANHTAGETIREVVNADLIKAPDQAIVFTELGFSTSTASAGVSDLAQARLLLTSLLDAASLGVRRTYVYQLLDAYPDPGGSEYERHFGVFDINYAPKPAARMLKRLAAVFADPANDAASFKVAHDDISVLGAAPDVRTLILQKAGGERVVALWREASVYDAHARIDLALTPETVDLRIPSRHGTVIVTDPIASTQGAVSAGAALVRVSLGSNPILVQVTARSQEAHSAELPRRAQEAQRANPTTAG